MRRTKKINNVDWLDFAAGLLLSCLVSLSQSHLNTGFWLLVP